MTDARRSRHALAASALSAAVSCLALACGGAEPAADHDDAATATEDLTQVPSEHLPSFIAGLKWFEWLETNFPDWYVTSPREELDPRPWPDGFDPGRDPIHAHNSVLIEGVTPSEVLALLRRGRSDEYYPNSSAATDCESGSGVTLTEGREYCWTTFGTVQRMRVAELVDAPTEAVVAWQGGSRGVEVYHRWMLRANPRGTLVVTEELERGLLTKVPLFKKKMNPSLHAAHELWLDRMRAVLAKTKKSE